MRRPFKKYRIVKAESDDMIKKVYKLRYEIYCNEVKLLNGEECNDRVESDEFDIHSIHLAVLDRKNEVVGTVRLIKNSILGLPTINEFKLSERLEKVNKEKTLEISRFMVKKNFRKTMLMVDMCKAVYQYTKQNDYHYMLGCAEKWFIISMNQLFGPLNVIGDPKFCFNAMNHPFILGVEEAERNNRKISKVLHKYFSESSGNIEI
ncbi:GNAT family N-acyltransferase [Patescibacteria group bacterium]